MSAVGTFPCGCVNVLDERWNLPRSEVKCEFHRRYQGLEREGLNYYTTIGAIDQHGVPQSRLYIRELLDPLAEMGFTGFPPIPDKAPKTLLEIGCGPAMYSPLVLRSGLTYTGIERAEWAANWGRNTYDVEILGRDFPVPDLKTGSFGAVLACHVLEHLPDSPGGMTEVWRLLAPSGVFVGIVPDDEDPTNPDHLWFYRLESLVATLGKAGFIGIKTAVRRRVKHENFIYFVARRSP